MRRAGRERPLLATVTSLVLHLGIAGLAAYVVTRPRHVDPPVELAANEGALPVPEGDAPIVVELPQASEQDLVAVRAEAATTVAPPAPTAVGLASGAKIEHPDDGAAGRGGSDQADEKARNLAARADEHTVASALRDDVLREQENRLDTADERASNVDRRMALEPMELTFVASGKGFRYERRPVARHDAALGAPVDAPASVAGSALGGAPSTEGAGPIAEPGPVGGPIAGSATPSPKVGAAYGAASIGSMQMVGAAVVKARPHVDPGKPAVAANDKGPAKDTVDGDQAVASALKSLVDTSSAGAPKPGEGLGGEGGVGAPGAGGKGGPGFSSTATGDGNGPTDGPREQRRLGYFLALQKRLAPLVSSAFPKEDELELRSGTVIVDLVIGKPGNVVDVIVIRPSGFSLFDRNVVDAIRGAGALEPVPDVLGGGAITVRVPVQGGWRLH